MEVIVFSDEAYQELVKKMDNLEKYFKHVAERQPLSDTILDIEETCLLLKISKRTLQNYRDDSILSYHQVGGKIYFRASAIEEHLNNHFFKAEKKPIRYIK